MKILGALLLLGIFTFASCKKDNPKRKKPLIKEETLFVPNVGQFKHGFTYTGENINAEQYFDQQSIYEYYNDKVLFNQFNANGSLWQRETFELDLNGYVNKYYSTLIPNIIYFFINQKGFIISERTSNGNNVSSYVYHYDENDLLQTISSYENNILKSTANYTQYDLDREYSISEENYGRAFRGKKFIHPPRKMQALNGNGQLTGVFEYDYTYDSEGRIIEWRITNNNVPGDTHTYEYY